MDGCTKPDAKNYSQCQIEERAEPYPVICAGGRPDGLFFE